MYYLIGFHAAQGTPVPLTVIAMKRTQPHLSEIETPIVGWRVLREAQPSIDYQLPAFYPDITRSEHRTYPGPFMQDERT